MDKARELKESGSTTAEILTALGISEATLNRWQATYGAMTKSEAKELQRLREENTRFKRLFGQAELEKGGVERIIGGKLLSPARRHDAVWHLVGLGYCQRRACQIVGLSRSAYRGARVRQGKPDKYADLRAWMQEFVRDCRRWGHRRGPRQQPGERRVNTLTLHPRDGP